MLEVRVRLLEGGRVFKGETGPGCGPAGSASVPVGTVRLGTRDPCERALRGRLYMLTEK